MKGTYMFFAEGFEETEALAAIDMLRRGGIEVKMVSISEDKTVTSSHNIPITTDLTFSEFKTSADFSSTSKTDVMIFPGGMPGSTNLAACTELMEIMLEHYAQGGCVAAICAAPSVVLGKLPELKGKRMTCYDGFEPALIEKGVCHTTDGVETDGNIITARGAGYAISFGLAIVAHIKGMATADNVARSIML